MDKKVFKILLTACAVTGGSYLLGRWLGNVNFPAVFLLLAIQVLIVYLVFRQIIKMSNAGVTAVWAVLVSTCLQIFAVFADWRRLDFFVSLVIYMIVYVSAYYIFVLWRGTNRAKTTVALVTLFVGAVLYILAMSMLADSIKLELNRML